LSSRKPSKPKRASISSEVQVISPKINWFAILITFGTLLLYFKEDVFAEPNYDGRSFNIAGLRANSGQILTTYDPIQGAGPFTYSPFSIPVFQLIYRVQSLFPFNVITILNLLSLVLFVHFGSQILNSRTVKVRTIILLLSLAIFHSPIQESIKIQQIDLILSALCVWSFFYLKSKNLSTNLLFFISLIKPQFILIYLVSLIQIRRKIPRHLLYILSLTIVEFFYFWLHKVSFVEFNALVSRFLSTSKSIASNIDVTNQSLIASLTRIFNMPEVLGRYYPAEFASTPIRMTSLFGFDRDSSGLISQMQDQSSLVRIGFIFSIILLLIKVIYPISLQNLKIESSHAGYFLISTFPIISPLFWYVHLVYLFPIFILLANISQSRKSQGLLLVSGILIFLTNWKLFGGNVVDKLLYMNVATTACILLLITILSSVKSIFRSKFLRFK